MLMIGRTCDIFNILEFAEKHPETGDHLDRLRETANVRVMRDRCPYAKAMDELRGKLWGESSSHDNEEEQRLDRDGDVARPTLSSQS